MSNNNINKAFRFLLNKFCSCGWFICLRINIMSDQESDTQHKSPSPQKRKVSIRSTPNDVRSTSWTTSHSSGSSSRKQSRHHRHSHDHDHDRSQHDDSVLNDSTDSFITGYNTSPATTPAGRDNKVGWYDIHEKHVKIANYSKATVVLCGDSIIAGLSRYHKIWNTYFRPFNALSMGIGGDRTQHVLWRAENIVLPSTTEIVVLHCGTNNIDRDQPRDIANGIASIGVVLQERKPGLKIVITGLLPRDLNFSHRRDKISKTNRYLKQLCQHKLKNFFYMKQDSDWTLEDGTLNTKLYYDDCLHLIETGNEKFAKSIMQVYYRVKESNLVYSDNESDIEGDNENSFAFERIRAEKRHKRFRSRSPSYSKSSERSNRKRRRSNSGSDTSPKKDQRSPYKWTMKDNKDHSTPNKWSSARQWSKVIKKEHHDKYSRMDSLTQESSAIEAPSDLESNETSMEGTVKSIDISLDEQRRLKARRAKFGAMDTGKNKDLATISSMSKAALNSPSALVRKIHDSQAQARQELIQKKHKVRRSSLVAYDSPPSSQDEKATPPKMDKNTKKLISDYASNSDSE